MRSGVDDAGRRVGALATAHLQAGRPRLAEGLLKRALARYEGSTHDAQHAVREHGPDLLTRDVRAAFHARFMVQFGAGGRAE